MSDYEKIAKLLIILGAVLALVEAILHFIGMGIVSFLGAFSWVGAIILLLLAILVLMMVFKEKPVDWDNGLIILILGILYIVFGSLIGGILLIIGAVLLFLD